MLWNANLTEHPIFSFNGSGNPILRVWRTSLCHGNRQSDHQSQRPQWHSLIQLPVSLGRKASALVTQLVLWQFIASSSHFLSSWYGQRHAPWLFHIMTFVKCFPEGFWLVPLSLLDSVLGDSMLALLQMPGSPHGDRSRACQWTSFQWGKLATDCEIGTTTPLPRGSQGPQSSLSGIARPKGFR